METAIRPHPPTVPVTIPVFDPQAFIDVMQPLLSCIEDLEARVSELEGAKPVPMAATSMMADIQESKLSKLRNAAQLVFDAYEGGEDA